ncbi:hypothetical protein E2C01_071506 [Portunus trituberculatus]|uniref:Uncharacterized protein n=1 Tax=Portunus trituberculatus TaxID=210409 RepID=A0A5B7I446_PORTR|nr:hypothetical protein [Portunus trituberculatus]
MPSFTYTVWKEKVGSRINLKEDEKYALATPGSRRLGDWPAEGCCRPLHSPHRPHPDQPLQDTTTHRHSTMNEGVRGTLGQRDSGE